uniref:Uncharacterized protein n=1 Tax=Craspedostauros australis TaxID=1486917 RepID=A0A7R9WRS3_9STRA|mmetsp:Transcript_1453/g.4026  ORF Transcript_1453/g.4026 Transcript_1453/m.4026 type:complete len:232 (+) Transcript_1453:258-953(+)
METDTNEDGTVFLPQDLPTSNEIIEAFNKLQEDSGLTIASLIAQVQVPCPDEATQLPAQFTQLIHLDIVDLNLSDGLQASVDNDPTILSQALGTCIPHTYKHLQSSKVCDSMAHQIIDASAIDVHASDDIDGAYSVSFEAGGSCSGCDPSNPSLFSDNDGGSRHLSQIGAAARTSIRPGKQRALSGGDTADEESELCFCNPDVVDEDHTPAMEDFVSALSECVVHALELGE